MATKLSFTKKLQGQLCDPGESAQFVCSAPASLSGLVSTWLKDNAAITDALAERVRISSSADNHFSLEIDRCENEDSGLYTCRITDPNNEESESNTIVCSAHLEVHQLSKEEREEREKSNHPVFMVRLKDSEFLLDSTASLMIHVKGNPNPKLTFFKDEQTLTEDERVVVNRQHEAHGSYELVIHHVQETDAGLYKVVAINNAGDDFSQAEITVKDAKDVFALLRGHEKQLVAGEAPTFTWFKAGEEFDPEDRFKVLYKDDEDTLALVFQHINPEDAGLYTCVASTSTGKISCSAELSIEGDVVQLMKEPEAPRILAALGDAEGALGGTAILELKMSGYPRPTAVWSKDGNVIEAGDRFKFIQPDPHTLNLIITSLEPSDEGVYEVVLTNDLGEARTEGKLTLIGAPQFLAPIPDQVAEVDAKFLIEVLVSGKPELIWYRNGAKVDEDRIECVKMDDDKFELRFDPVLFDDEANWAVIAKNSVGEMSQFFKFTVHQKPSILEPLEDKEVNEGKNVIFKCRINGIPSPEIKWTLNEEEVEPKGNLFKIFKDPLDDKLFCMEIKEATPNMSGPVGIKATNDMGEAESKANLKVNTLPRPSQMEDGEAVEGDSYVFTVNCPADPLAQCQWMKDGVPIDLGDKDHFEVEQDGEVYRLTIKNLDKDTHTALYSAKFTNVAGEAEVEAKLNVLSQEELKEPKCLNDLDDKRVRKGNDTSFEIKIRGNPEPKVQWYSNDKELVAGPHFKMSVNDDFVYRLDIVDATEEMEGPIKVMATNENGQDQREAKLEVVYPPELEPIKEAKVGPGETAILECRVKSNPMANISWGRKKSDGSIEVINLKSGAKDDKDKAEDTKWDRIRLEEEPEAGPWSLHRLVLSDARLTDTSDFVLIAVNDVGKGESIGSISVFVEPPVFVLPLKNKDCRLTTEQTLECTVKGVPKPELEWFKDGNKLELDSERVRVETYEDKDEMDNVLIKSVLTLCDVEMNDFGEYRALASNEAGSASSEGTLSLTMLKPSIKGDFPKLLELDDDGTNDLILSAQVDGSPPPKATWLFNGEPVVPDGKRIIITEEPGPDPMSKITTLIVHNVNPEDAGKYTLHVENEVGEAEAMTPMVVKAKPRPPEVIVPLPDHIEVQGHETLKLECRIVGQPLPEIKWYRDNVEIKAGRKGLTLVPNDKGNVALIIECAKESDCGLYSAKGVNPHGQAETKGTVIVSKPMEEPKFTANIKSAKAVEGSPVTLDGKVSGHPMPDSIEWLKDGQPFKPDGIRVMAFYDPATGDFGLKFTCVEPDDKANYTAVAKNEVGEARCSAPLNVLPKERKDKEEEAPSFLKNLTDMSVDEGQKLRMTAPIKGNPLPDFKWTKDGKAIDLNRITVFCDGETVGLEIPKAAMSDLGLYECTLTNPLGTAVEGCNVTVNKVFRPPVFTKELQDREQLRGGEARLVCVVGANPEPRIVWKLNNKPIDVDSKPGKYRVLDDGNKRTLIIRDVDDEDVGEYTCHAANSEGEAESKARLSVVDKLERKFGKAPEFLKTIGDELVFRGMGARFTAVFVGDPEPDFEFTFKGQAVQDKAHVVRELSGMVKLTLPYVDERDLGDYELRIWNEHGEASCKASLAFDALKANFDDQPLADLYQTLDRRQVEGGPAALPDKPIVSQMTDTSVALVWKPVLGMGNANTPPVYRVEVAEYPDGEWSVAFEETKGIQCEVNDLTPFRDYRFRVSARNQFGFGDPSPFVVAHRSLMAIPEDLHQSDDICDSDQPFDLSLSTHFPPNFDLFDPQMNLTDASHPPRFLRRESDLSYGVKRSTATLTWRLYGQPVPEVRFTLNDEAINTNSGKFGFEYDRSGVVTLNVRDFGADDVGLYTCLAINEAGEAKQNVELELARAPEFTREPEDVNLVGVNGGKVWCEIWGVPEPKVTWFKDFHPLKETFRVQAHVYPDERRHMLYFDDYITQDEGLYTVVASNVAGCVSHSVVVRIVEDELAYDWMTYRRTQPIIPKERGFEQYYVADKNEALGEGTQGIVELVQQVWPVEGDARGHHAVEEADSKYWWLHRGVKQWAPTLDPVMAPYRFTGGNFAAKTMKMPPLDEDMKVRDSPFKKWMVNELDVMNCLHHPKLIRLVDAYAAEDEMSLIMELASGGELLERLTQERYITEIQVARIVRQILEGLSHMHEKGIAHLGLTPRDVLFSKPGGGEVKIGDFSLARRVVGNSVKLDHGQPEFVAPEVVNGDGATFASDLWSVGIITYLTLSGISPFRGQNDRETLQRIQMGDIDFDFELWNNISREAKHFVANLLVYKPEERMSVKQALNHPWLQILRQPGIELGEQFQIPTEKLSNYFVGLKYNHY